MKPDLYSVLLIDGDNVYDRSSAALRIAQGMRAPWPALGVFLILPRPIRDALYNLVARVRYRISGRSESCPMPPPGLRDRFLSS